MDEGLLDYEAEQILEEVDEWADGCGNKATFDDYIDAGTMPTHPVVSLDELYELEREYRRMAS